MSDSSLRLLLIESDARIANIIVNYLTRYHDYAVEVVSDSQSAEQKFCASLPDVLVVNDWLGNSRHNRQLCGLELAHALLAEYQSIPFILYNRNRGPEGRERAAKESGASSYIYKSWRFLKLLEDEVQQALDNKHSQESLRDKEILEKTRALWTHYHRITSALNLDETYKHVCHAIVDLVHADHCGLVIFDADLARGWLRGEYPGLDSGQLEIPVRGIPFEERLIATRKPQIVSDVFVATDLGDVSAIWTSLEIFSIVVVPICIHGRVIGSLSMDSRRHFREFTKVEIELCEFFAHQIAPIIYNAQLYDETQRQLADAEQLRGQVEEQKNQIARTFRAAKPLARAMAAGELKAVLETVSEGLQDALDCDVVLLYRYDAAQHKMDYPPVYTDGLYFPEEVAQHGQVLADSIIYETLWMPHLEAIPDTQQDARFATRRFSRREKIRSLVRLPLQAGHHRVGVLFANYREPRVFSDQELDLITYFANLAAVAIDNAGFEHALTALYESNKALAGDNSAGLEEMFAQLARRVVELIVPDEGNSECASYIALLRGDSLEFVAAEPPELLPRLRAQFPIHRSAKKRGIIGRTIWEAHRYQNIGNVYADRDYIPLLPGTRSQLTVLMKEGETIIGAFSVEHVRENAFTASDVKKLKNLAAQAALALQRARARRLLAQRAEWFKRVLELARGIGSSQNLQETLAAACRALVELLGVSHVGLVLFNDALTQGTVMEEYPSCEVVGTLIPLRGIPFEVQLIQTRKPVVVQHPAQNPGLGSIQAVFEKLGTQSLLLVPVQVNGKLIGSFGLDVIGATRAFTDDEIELCEAFASQAGLAIEKAQLYEELEEKKKALDALEDENDNRIEFIKLLDHIHLRVPRDVQHVLELILNENLGALNPKQREWLATAHEEVSQHRRFLGALKSLVPRPARDDEVLPLKGVVKEVFGLVAPFARRKQVALYDQYGAEPCLRGNYLMLAVTLLFLVDNAIKYTSAGGEVVVEVDASNQWVRLSVDDTGCGVPVSEEPMLGFPGYRGANAYAEDKDDGMGLGLYFARGYVRRSGGELVLSRKGDQGFRAMAYLPRAQSELGDVNYSGV